MKRKYPSSEREQHYYKEVGKRIVCIEDEEEQKKIDKFMKRHSTTPPGTSRETGYSSYMFTGRNVEVNTSMVKKQKIDKEHYLISRTSKAPTLPVSCLASAEHVIAMQDKVANFKSESEPKSKHKVMYHIQLSCSTKKMNAQDEKKAIISLIHKHDTTLNKNNIRIIYNKRKAIFTIRTSTQVADIQLLVRALTSEKKYNFVDCTFKDIGLNQGICLVKKDASNPIHALVNIADSNSEKGFLERDAGTTSGRHTAAYQDRKWTFNFFSSLEEMRKRTEYPSSALAIKILNAN